MIGMNFASFLTLLILGLIAAIILHSSTSYWRSHGTGSFFAKWIAGWIGGWLGSPVFGHWWFRIQNVYVIPALIGAFVGAFALIYWHKANVAATPKAVPAATERPMQRMAS